MKHLELQLQKRLIIVEADNIEQIESVKKIYTEYGQLICKGAELTEEVAKGLVHQSIHTQLFAHYVKDIPVNTYCYKSALDSFKSAIEAQGYYWGENPEGKQRPRFNDYSSLISYQGDCKDWDEAESRTFNPEKTLIFKILS